MQRLCFLDMDGVLCDFVRGSFAFHGKYLEYEEVSWDYHEKLGLTPEEFWLPFDEGFWAGLSKFSHLPDLLGMVENCFGIDNVFICTMPRLTGGCAVGKVKWVEREIPRHQQRLILTDRKDIFSGPNRILIDDSDNNCRQWNQCGGKSILFPQPWNALAHLRFDPISYIQEELLKC